MHECNPIDYLTRKEHEDHCSTLKEWAEEVIKSSENDRNQIRRGMEKLDTRLNDLEKLIPRFQWWFIGILVAIIISSYVMPRLTSNGTHKSIEELNGKINLIMEKQDIFDNTLNAVRYDQQRREAREK